MDTLARWQRATEWLGACGIDAKKLGHEVAEILEMHACAVVRDDLGALVAILEAVGVSVGAAVSLSTLVPAPRVVVDPVAAQVAAVVPAAPPAAPVPASPTAVAVPSAPAAPAAAIAPATPAEVEAAFAAQITGARSLRELATLGVKVARAGMPKEATDRLQAAYQARKAGLGGGAPKAPAGAPVVPRGGVAAPVAPPMPPAAQTPAGAPAVAPGGAVVAPLALASHPWIAARFFAGGGRQILGYVSAATNQAAIDAAEAKWGVGGGVGVMDLALCSALELAEADKAVGRASPTGVAASAPANGGGKKIQVEMPAGFTPDPDADAQEEA